MRMELETWTVSQVPRTVVQLPTTTDLCAWILALGPWPLNHGPGKIVGKILTADL